MPRKKITSNRTKKTTRRFKTTELESMDIAPVTDYSDMESEKPKRKFPFLGFIILIIIFFVLGSVIYKNKGLLIAGTVNGKPVFTFEIYKKLVSQSGKQTFDQITTEKLIQDEANKKNIKITDSDINNEVKKVQDSLGETTNLNDALLQQGMTMQAFREQLKLRLIAVKLIGDKVKVTDADVDKYIKDNQDSLTKDEDQAKQREQIKSFLNDQQVSQEIQKIIEDLKGKAKIVSFL